MANVTNLQQAFLDQFIQRKSKVLFNRADMDLLEEKWHLLLHEKVSEELGMQCQFPLESGKTCNRHIKNIYTIESESGALLKVGSNCLNKVIPIDELDKIEKQAEKLKQDMEAVNNLYPAVPKRTFTMEEKENLLKRVAEEGILPEDIRSLLEQGVPLSDSVYNGLHTNLYNLEQHKKRMAEDSRREEERREQREAMRATWQETLPPREKPAGQPQHAVLTQKLKEGLKKADLSSIYSVQDALRVAEVGLLIYVEYAPPGRMNIMRYSEVVREIGFVFKFETDTRNTFIETTIDHAETFVLANSYRVIRRQSDDFLFQ